MQQALCESFLSMANVDWPPGQHLLFREDQAFLSMQLPFHMQLPILGQKERKVTKLGLSPRESGAEGHGHQLGREHRQPRGSTTSWGHKSLLPFQVLPLLLPPSPHTINPMPILGSSSSWQVQPPFLHPVGPCIHHVGPTPPLRRTVPAHFCI